MPLFWQKSIIVSIICAFFISPSFVTAQNSIRLQGTVTDAATGKSLPFVYIIINDGAAGANTDLNGRFNFQVNIPIEKITFTHLSYETFVYKVKTPEDLQPLQRLLQIPLYLKSNQLSEVTVGSINPAHRIIKKAVKNRHLHNPKKLPFYKYNSYSKFFVNTEYSKDTVLPSPKDSGMYKMALYLKDYHIFLAESVTEYQFLSPNYQYEKVIANRVAGLQNPQFIALSTQGQLLNFYEDHLDLLNRKYLNPISENAWTRYDFTLEDSILVSPDTLFWISFEPLPNKNFDGLKGRLAIHSRTFAIQSMSIESALPESEVGLGFRLEQQYEWVNETHWFPKQVRTELIFRRIKLGNKRLIAQWQTYLSDLDFKNKPPLRNFIDASLVINADAHLQNKELWASYRSDTLSKKEKDTYIALDSIGAKAKFDKSLWLSQYLSFARVPINKWKMDLDLKQTLNYNRYEGFRIGAGFLTNDLFSKKYALGSYLAYGTRDGNFKYGFSGYYHPFSAVDASLSAAYISDIQETGRIRFMQENTGIVIAPNRDFFIGRVDKIRRFELKAQARPLQNIRLGVMLSTQRILPAYAYSFTAPQTAGEPLTYQKYYQLTELNFQLQYFWGAQYLRMGNLRFLGAAQLPSLHVSYTQGLRALNNDFRYGKWEARFAHEYTFRNIGTLHGEVWLGAIKGIVPYHVLWNGQGTGRTVPPLMPSYFQAMDMYEFLNDRFIFVFLTHNFRKLLYKSHYKWFQPEPILHHNFAWGNLRNPEAHQGIETQTLQKGYWETGLQIKNILKLKYMQALKIGLGGGVFFRYGYYSRANFSENIAYKFSLTIGI